MTEDEAKTKWCPFGRYSSGASGHSGAGGSWNRSNNNDAPTTFCIGSACMAWRTNTDVLYKKDPDKYPLLGYCGLAGK